MTTSIFIHFHGFFNGLHQGKQADKGGEEEPQPQRTLKGRRERPATLTRFDDTTLSKEQAELEDQLSKSQEMRKKWTKAIDKTKNEVNIL